MLFLDRMHQGLHAPIPLRKYSSDHDLSSDSEPEGETYSSEEDADAGVTSPPDCDPFDDPDGHSPPSIPFISDMPLGPQYAALNRTGPLSPRSLHAIQPGDNVGDNQSSITPPPAPDLVAPQQQGPEGIIGSEVYSAGMDALSLPEHDLSPPLSPRAMSPTTVSGVAAVVPPARDGGAGVVLRSPPGRRRSAPAPFVSHPPPPDHSPPRWPLPSAVGSAGGGGRDDDEADRCGDIAEAGRSPGGDENARDDEAVVRASSRPRSPTLSLWPAEEADGGRVSLEGTMDLEEGEEEEEGGESREADGTYSQEEELLAQGGGGTASGRLDVSVGSSPASFESLRPESRDQPLNMLPIRPPSPVAPAPSRLAPRPPPPEPLAPPPPRPQTPDEPLAPQQGSLLPESPAEPAPTIGARSRHFMQPESSSLPGLEQRRMEGINRRSSEGGKGSGQFHNLHVPPPHSPASGPRSTTYSSGGSSAAGGGGGVGSAGKTGSPAFGSGGGGGAGPSGSFGSGASASTRVDSSWKANTTGSFNFGGSGAGGGGGGISRLMGPNGPFGSNRPGYGSGGYGGRARYHSGGSGGNGRSHLYGSAPGTLGDGSSSWSEQGLRGR